MRIRVVYLGLFRSKTGKTEEQYDLAERSSLADFFEILAKNYGEKLQSIFSERRESRLDPTFVTAVNGILKDPLLANNVTLKDGDTVALMTLVSGG